jgi:enoyl-CoA hydratase
MNLQFVSLKREGCVATLSINNPSSLNALNSAILTELSVTVEEISNDDSINVVIITGEGRAFVAGADIQEMAELNSADGELFGKRGTDLFRRIETLEKPVIAAVNGFALGGGCELAMSCDIRIASESAKFGQPEVGLGITPGFGGTVRMTKLVGPAKAKELIFTGRVIDAMEALSIGLVNKVVPAEELISEAHKMAEIIASKAPVAVRLSKKAINYSTDYPAEESASMENRLFGSCFDTLDQKEGMKAFLQKRKPEFNNR